MKLIKVSLRLGYFRILVVQDLVRSRLSMSSDVATCVVRREREYRDGLPAKDLPVWYIEACCWTHSWSS